MEQVKRLEENKRECPADRKSLFVLILNVLRQEVSCGSPFGGALDALPGSVYSVNAGERLIPPSGNGGTL